MIPVILIAAILIAYPIWRYKKEKKRKEDEKSKTKM
tara:strand:+ start:57 stop:164 length:108 start_codon:yes stop_codon:yes gene_type:complete